MQSYVPGYRFNLPAYAGNLDIIMTSAALRTGEKMALRRLTREAA